MCPVILIALSILLSLPPSWQVTLGAPEDAVVKKEEGISDKSSLLTLEEEHDLLKAESQDVPSEVKPLYQVSVNFFYFHFLYFKLELEPLRAMDLFFSLLHTYNLLLFVTIPTSSS